MSKPDYIYYDIDSERKKGIVAVVVIFFLGVCVGILLMKFIF